VGYVPQTYNNCGPASVIAALEDYGMTTDQTALAKLLRPVGGYMTVGVIAPFLNSVGLDTTYFKGGRSEHLMRLIAAGIPVIVLQWLDREGGIPHYRVVRGYDVQSGIFWVSDSMYGANAYIRFSDFEKLWSVYDNAFLPVYRLGEVKRVKALMGV